MILIGRSKCVSTTDSIIAEPVPLYIVSEITLNECRASRDYRKYMKNSTFMYTAICAMSQNDENERQYIKIGVSVNRIVNHS